MQFRYDIQGLRAIAVLLVFIFHLTPMFLSGGFIGVDIFFVISGYLVSGIILYKIKQKKFNFIDFYVGRVKRLIPTYFIFLLAVIFFGTFIYLSIDINSLKNNIFWSYIFGSNNFLATQDDYFGAKSSENPLLHTWTLSIEMQFYFLLPFYLFVVNRKYLFLFTLLIILILTCYSSYNIYELNNKNEMYFSLLARIPEFLIGVIFSLKEKEINNKFSFKLKNILTIISLLLIILSSIVYSENSNFPGFLALIPCISTGVILVFKDSIVNKRFLNNKVLAHLGEISYSIYLWHWSIMAFYRYYFNKLNFDIVDILIIISLTIVLAELSYSLIENKSKKIENKTLIFTLIILSVLIGGIYFKIEAFNKRVNNLEDLYTKPTFGLNSHGNKFKNVEIFGNKSKDNDSILLIGDSHALVYKGILNTIGEKNNFNFRTITNDRYPNLPYLDSKDFINEKFYDQYSKISKITNIEIKKSKYILISSIWLKDIKSLNESFEKFINELEPNQKLIILTDFPVLDKNPIKHNRGIVRKNNVDNNFKVKINTIPPEIVNITHRYNNVYILEIDYSDVINELPFKNDTILYYDEGHLNYFGGKQIGKVIEKQFYNKFKKIIK